jgi:hypothetical protein
MPLGSTVYRGRVNSRAKRFSHQKQWVDGREKRDREKGRGRKAENTERERERE